MSIIGSIFKTSWDAITGLNPDEPANNRSLLPLSFVKEAPGTLGERDQFIWLRNIKELKENGIPTGGIPCRVGLSFERAVLTSDAIIYPGRLYKKDQSKSWQPT